MRPKTVVTLAAVLAVCSAPAHADESGAQAESDSAGTVSREEFDALRRSYDELREAFREFRDEAAQRDAISSLAPDRGALSEQIEWLSSRVDAQRSGQQRFLVSGFGTASYTNPDGENSNFAAGVFPVFLFRLSDRILFESEFHASVGGGGHEDGVELSYAHASYLASDWLTLGAGQFLSPFGTFQERLHASWINKLPSNPLIYGHDGALAPEAMLGVQARGAFPFDNGAQKISYSAWLVNGPELVDANVADGAEEGDGDAHAKPPAAAEGHDDEPAGPSTGLLDFDTSSDNNNNKAFGARVAYFPVPWMEIGGSYWGGQAGPSSSDFRDVDFRLLGADFVAQFPNVDALSGHLELRSEWIWSDVDDDYLHYDNRRDGGYVQLAYRPQFDHAATVLNDVEGVLRYDAMDVPSGAPQVDTTAWTVGINYWLSSTSVLKLAVESRRRSGASDDTNLLVEWALGF